MRDLFYGTLEHFVRSCMVRGRNSRDKRETARDAARFMKMLRPAFGLTSGGQKENGANLSKIAKRLEAVAERLESAR